jgi:hypothetical protein
MESRGSLWRRFGYHRLLPWLAIGLTVVGARLWLISQYGTSLPIHDQWDAEGFYLLKPWSEGRLGLADLLGPHNEHRIFFSRLLTLALTFINGQWDSVPAMVFDALLCGVIAILCAAIPFSFFKDRFRVIIVMSITLWLALPYAHENTLWAFQSSFYFLLFFSLLGIWGLTLHRPFSLRWSAGVLGAVCACLSMGSGFFAAVVAAAILFLQVVRKEGCFRDLAPTALLVAVILAISLHFRVDVPYHAMLKAQSFGVWLNFFGRCLAWPLSAHPILALITYCPLVLLSVSDLTRRRAQESPTNPLVWLLFAIGLWVILQAAAAAYSRAGSGSVPVASRYLDILGLGVVVNIVSLCLLLAKARTTPYAWTTTVAGSIWFVAILTCAITASYREIHGQYGRQDYLRSAEKAVRGYLATKERRFIEGEPHPVPYPDVAGVVTFLDDKTIQTLLPAGARLPLHLEKSAGSDTTFSQPGCAPGIEVSLVEKSWGSYSAEGDTARGSMTTEVFRPRLPYLQLNVAGGLDQERSLLIEANGPTSPIKWLEHYPRREAHPQWRVAYARIPGPIVRIAARDDSRTSWFAFREPREMGALSYYCYRFVESGKIICLCGIGFFTLFFLGAVWPLVANIAIKKKTA